MWSSFWRQLVETATWNTWLGFLCIQESPAMVILVHADAWQSMHMSYP